MIDSLPLVLYVYIFSFWHPFSDTGRVIINKYSRWSETRTNAFYPFFHHHHPPHTHTKFYVVPQKPRIGTDYNKYIQLLSLWPMRERCQQTMAWVSSFWGSNRYDHVMILQLRGKSYPAFRIFVQWDDNRCSMYRDRLGVNKTALDFLPNMPTTTTV